MRRKSINHYADVVCRMVMGGRMSDDLESLADLPDGRIHLDLLSGSAEHYRLFRQYAFAAWGYATET